MSNTTAADTVGMSDPGRKPATTTDDVLDVFESRDDRAEPLTAPELAEDLNCSRRTALNKLHDLEDDGRVSSKKVGGRSKVWWVPIHDTPTVDEGLPEDAVNRETVAEDDVTPPTSDPDQTTGDDDNDEHAAESAAEDRREQIDAALAESDPSPERRGAVRACVEYLQDRGTAQKSDFVEDVYPDHSAGFKTSGGWWNKIGKDYLDDVADEYPPVKRPPKEGSHTWSYDP